MISLSVSTRWGKLGSKSYCLSVIALLLLFVATLEVRAQSTPDLCNNCEKIEVGGDTVLIYREPGEDFFRPPFPMAVEYLVVGGGGGGGAGGQTGLSIFYHGGGGGGAGGVRQGMLDVSAQSYSVTVGSGGFGSSNGSGGDGGSSSFSSVIATGGGGGGGFGNAGNPGASGGGGGGAILLAAPAGGSGVAGQGSSGGAGAGGILINRAGGGGGGYSSSGGNGAGAVGGTGGAGLSSNISGSGLTYASGGNGGGSSGSGSPGATNTGNGGEGGWGNAGRGGDGGSGIVVIRYPTPAGTYYSRASGNWSNPATWTTQGCNSNIPATSTPHPSAAVVICESHNLVLDESVSIASLQFAEGRASSLTHVDGAGLAIGSGGVTMGAATSGPPGNRAWNINNGSAVINGDLVLAAHNNPNRLTLIDLESGTLDINGNMSISGNPANTLVRAHAAANIYVAGSVDRNLRFNPGNASTFTYDGIGVQEVVITEYANYHNLVLAGGGTKNQSTGWGRAIAGTTTVEAGVIFNNSVGLVYRGDFINRGNVAATAAQAYQGNFINSGSYTSSSQQHYLGNFTNTGVFNSGAAAHHFEGSASQQLSGETEFDVLTVDNPAGLVINGDVVVRNQLQLTAGVVTTNDHVLRVAQPGNWSGINRGTGWVAGNLALYFPGGWSDFTFPLGDASSYRPLQLNQMNIVSAGYVLARVSQSQGDHPLIASSGLDASRSVNRWWSLRSEGVVVESTFQIRMEYLLGDVDLGADPYRFEIQRLDGSWQDVVALGRNIGGSIQSIQGRSTGFGDFAIAEPGTSGPGPLPAAMIEYRMDEDYWSGSAADVFDSSGKGRHGTARGGATTADSWPAVPSDPGTCRYGHFDGSNDYIEVPGLSGILNGTASMAFWIRTTQVGRSQAWESPGIAGVEVAGGADDIFWGWIDDTGRIGISVGNNFNNKSTVRINDNNWHHVVLSRDHLRGRYQIYIDGVLNNSGTIATGIIGNHYTDIGRIVDTAGSHEYFAGDLDELRIFDRMLLPAEVQALYAETRPCSAQLCPGGVAQPGLIGSYYENRFLAGEPVATRVDGPINFNWDTGVPAPGLPADNFSIEWNGFLRVTETGLYHFRVTADDGVRLHLNGSLIIDEWRDQSASPFEARSIYLAAGHSYPIRLQHYENGGHAVIQLEWHPPSAADYVPIPAGPASLGAGLYSCSINAVSYYGISHSGNGLTCEAEPITITAYDATHNPIAPPPGTELFLWTEPATASWAGGDLAVFDGESSSLTKYLRQTTAVGALDINVSDGITSEHPLHDPPISFADVGLKFYGSRDGGPVPHQMAGVQDAAVVMRVVETDTETGACVARVPAIPRPVGFAYECRDPDTCSSGQTLLLNGAPIHPNNNDGAPLAFSDVTTNFDAEGYAALPFVFSDVGRIRLLAQLALPAEDEHEAITLQGSSNDFVVKPYTLAISVDSRNPGTTDSGGGFVAAGEPFSVRIEARNAAGEVTPAFGRESTPAAVQVEHDLLWPAGGSAGSLSNSGAFAPVAPGVFENPQLIWNQVGSISLQPALAGNDYLGAGGLAQTPAASGAVGRFYPYEYRLLSGEVSNGCGSFTYMDQPAIRMSYTIEARGYNMGVVSNYDTALGYGSADVWPVADNIEDDSVLDRIAPGANSSWSGGLLSLSSTQANFARNAAGADGPFPRVRVGVSLNDTLDGRSLIDLDMRTDASGNCPSGSECAATLSGELHLRFGRLRLNSAFGPESSDLPADFLTEYWDGSGWRLNSEDSCSQIAASDIIYNEGNSLAANPVIAIGAGETEAVFYNYAANSVHFVGGRALDYFKAPGAGNMGSFTMQVSPENYPWFTFDWDGDGLHDSGPHAQFNFGSYRGHDRVIYWREVFD